MNRLTILYCCALVFSSCHGGFGTRDGGPEHDAETEEASPDADVDEHDDTLDADHDRSGDSSDGDLTPDGEIDCDADDQESDVDADEDEARPSFCGNGRCEDDEECCTLDCPARCSFYFVERATSPIMLDGDLSDFSEGRPLSLIADGDDASETVFYLLYDDDALYIGVRGSDTSLWALLSEPDDSLWRDDSMEIFFDTEADGGAVNMPNPDDFKFLVNLNNARSEGRGTWSPWSSWDMEWSSFVVVDSIVNDGDGDVGYVIEARIPWSEWAAAGGPSLPAPGTLWGCDIKTNDKDGEDLFQEIWFNSDGGDVNNPDGWGEIIFE